MARLLKFVLFLVLPYSVLAVPTTRTKRDFAAPVVTISKPDATIVGSSAPFIDIAAGAIESFKGIPFAQPPTGSLRFKPPQRLNSSLGTVRATQDAPPACPQFLIGNNLDISGLPQVNLQPLLQSPLFKSPAIQGQEDCLTLNVQRPAGTKSSSKLPVLVWIFGGGFEFGSTQIYDASSLISSSVALGKPFVFVAMNYRIGGFGFMPGKEILADGSANAGLLDQRLALQWVADNIEAFGGDSDKVTIWGESAGAISAFDQMVLFNGDITYNGKPLFRGAIMDSGSAIPVDNVDSAKGQKVYDTVVATAGCSQDQDTLACLRALPFEKLISATNSVPSLLSFTSLALSYLPRPDGKVLMASPETLVTKGTFPKVPFILGDQEDEGTLFALFQSNITTTADIESYLKEFFFADASPELVHQLVASYPDDPAAGSPFGTGNANNWYPQYKRLAAMLGDLAFTLARRGVFNTSTSVNPDVPSWSYLSSYDSGTPILGTLHASDLLQTFFGILPNDAAFLTQSYYFNFVYNLDPNNGQGGTPLLFSPTQKLPNWPAWQTGNQMVQFNANNADLITDNFRQASFDVIFANTPSLRL